MSTTATPSPATVPVEIKSRWDDRVLFTAQVDASIPAIGHIKAALRVAIEAGAYLAGAKLPHFQIPQGSLAAWKKASGKLVKLLIPAEARRTATLIGRKCRAEYAIVLEVEGGKPVESNRGHVIYAPGETVRPDSYDPDPRVECTHGIHFFLTREEAEEWC